MICYKIANKIQVLKLHQRIVSRHTNEAENNGLDREIPKEDIYLKKKRQKITDDLRLK